MSRTAALSWAEFDDEADAPSFDVLGDLATAPTLRAADPCPAKSPIPYAYPSLAPRSTVPSAHAQLPAPDSAPDYSFMAGSRPSGTTGAAASAPAPRVAAAPRNSSASVGQPVVGKAVFKPFKPPRKLAEEGGDRLPAANGGSRLAPRRAADKCQSSAQLAASQHPSAPVARSVPVKSEPSSVVEEAMGSCRLPADGPKQAAASRQASEAPWRRVRSSDTSSPSVHRAGAGTETVLPHVGGQAARGDTFSPLDKSAASMACADSLHDRAARQSSVLLQQPEARHGSTPAKQRSRKKAKRLFPTDDAEAAGNGGQVRHIRLRMHMRASKCHQAAAVSCSLKLLQTYPPPGELLLTRTSFGPDIVITSTTSMKPS